MRPQLQLRAVLTVFRMGFLNQVMLLVRAVRAPSGRTVVVQDILLQGLAERRAVRPAEHRAGRPLCRGFLFAPPNVPPCNHTNVSPPP